MKKLSQAPAIHPSALVVETEIGRYTEVGQDSKLTESVLGDYSYVTERCDIIYTEIGKFSNIASDVRINPGNHPMDWVSQHHFLYRRKQYGLRDTDNEQLFNWRRIQKVTIGHDTWLGHRSIIMPGVSIGNGAVVAAGAIVTKDVPPYTIVAGVPAKAVRTRFPKAVWQSIEKTQWWNWDHDTLKERLEDFYDLRLFLERYGNQ